MLNLLQNLGWVSYQFEGKCLEEHMLEVASQLGTVVSTRKQTSAIEILTPVRREDARTSSLSRRFGLGALPLHTDTAHWEIPSRYMVLGCKNPGYCDRKTILSDSGALKFGDDQRQIIKDAQFRVLNGRHSFFASIIGPNDTFIRFDLGCMMPIDAKSEVAITHMMGACTDALTHTIEWTEGSILIIDNWRILHGRTAPKNNDNGRVLLRVLAA